LIADNQMRKRDERFKDQAKYKATARSALRQGAPEEGRAATTSPPTSAYDADSRHVLLSGG
jgi:hypothetical protein